MKRISSYCIIPVLLIVFGNNISFAQQINDPAILFSFDSIQPNSGKAYKTIQTAQPLEILALKGIRGSRIKITDGLHREYASLSVKPVTSFCVAGALGVHTISIYDKEGKIMDTIHFTVDAHTNIDDHGSYKQLFDVLYKGMCVYAPNAEQSLEWNGKKIHFFESWELDNYNVLKGMQYFSPYGRELTDVMRTMQRKDGMIWSFIAGNNTESYFETAYKRYGFFLRDGNCYFVRQPVENHVEYIYVNTIYKYWKGSGDDDWMKNSLASAAAALNYVFTDSLRWSSRYQLLKRGLTIDSWDFQVDDEYTPKLGTGNPMLVELNKTKFGIFYGDNTGYIQACHELAEMYDYIGKKVLADQFRQRAEGISARLNALCWNGRFFTHFIEEDPAVKRNLGVDMMSQFSQSNAYSLNRGLSHDKSVAIIKTYLDLKGHLPKGAPAEWFSIYPPFERGFEPHDAKWQYMNGGVGGHIAGELALGAFENGYESYGADILKRLLDLGNKYGEGKRIWFAYTGSIPDSPVSIQYKTIDLSPYANMDFWDKSKGASLPWMNNPLTNGDDLRNLPVGDTTLHGILFHITDPAQHNRKGAIAVSSQKDFPKQVVIPVNDTAESIYLLHATGAAAGVNIFGSVSIQYEDGTMKTQYLMKEKQLSNWWFPHYQNDNMGVAWSGPNLKSTKVGVYWLALDNPQPHKKIANIMINASLEDDIYILLGLTLSSQKHYIRPHPESFGGPDDWAAATGMAALIEGLAGVKDKGLAYRLPMVSPRWVADNTDSVNVTARYAASQGYLAYHFIDDKNKKQIRMQVAGSGDSVLFHVLLPAAVQVKNVISGPGEVHFIQSRIENSEYADFSMKLRGEINIAINYK